MKETGVFLSEMYTGYVAKNKLQKTVQDIAETMDGLLISDADLFLYELNRRIDIANLGHAKCKELKLVTHRNVREEDICAEIDGVLRLTLHIVQGYHEGSEIEQLPEAMDKLIIRN